MSILGIVYIFIFILWVNIDSIEDNRIYRNLILVLLSPLLMIPFLTNFYFAMVVSISILLWAAYYLTFQTTPSKEK